ncbi:unnamed protein product [Schistocephalus solidus]|uniref:Uncharacterized protein n=1 Tax=Schistocephalus solidus TaxID=70667 RepID=A0A183SPV8_SCHSO|nr:unnamed protein product [Schistocephalus solidus]
MDSCGQARNSEASVGNGDTLGRGLTDMVKCLVQWRKTLFWRQGHLGSGCRKIIRTTSFLLLLLLLLFLLLLLLFFFLITFLLSPVFSSFSFCASFLLSCSSSSISIAFVLLL